MRAGSGSTRIPPSGGRCRRSSARWSLSGPHRRTISRPALSDRKRTRDRELHLRAILSRLGAASGAHQGRVTPLLDSGRQRWPTQPNPTDPTALGPAPGSTGGGRTASPHPAPDARNAILAHRLCNRIDYSIRVGRGHARDLERIRKAREEAIRRNNEPPSVASGCAGEGEHGPLLDVRVATASARD